MLPLFLASALVTHALVQSEEGPLVELLRPLASAAAFQVPGGSSLSTARALVERMHAGPGRLDVTAAGVRDLGAALGVDAAQLVEDAWASGNGRALPVLAVLPEAGVTLLRAPRSREPTMQVPIKSDANYDYFRKAKAVSVKLPKPLGAVLEESGAGGVRVEDVQEGGSAFATKELKKGDWIQSVGGQDVKEADFDTVMELLIAAPEEVELEIQRTVIVRKPKVVPTLTIDGEAAPVERGVILRTAIRGTGAELYKGMMSKMNQCGGVGGCNLCWVDVLDGAENLSPPTDVEKRKGKKKPPTYRMSCQAVVNGDVSVATTEKR